MRAPARPRDAHLDNVKAVLIVLVVVGHALEPIQRSLAAESIYRWIYLFHMPAFVLVTGYLSRSFRPTLRSYVKLVLTIALPYVIFQAIQAWARHAFTDVAFRLDLLTPIWTLWFLPALFIWRALVPLLRRIPFVLPISLLGCFAAAAFVDHLPTVLALNRAIVLLPFFVLGLKLPVPVMTGLKDRTVRRAPRILVGVLGTAVLAGVTALTYHLVDGRGPFLSRQTLGEYDAAGPWPGAALWLLITATALVGTTTVVAVTSRGPHWWTYIGRYSLYVYLLHSIVLYPLQAAGIIDWPASVLAVVLIAVGAVGLAVLLAARPVRRVSRLVVEPPVVEPVATAVDQVADSVSKAVAGAVTETVVPVITETVVPAVTGTVGAITDKVVETLAPTSPESPDLSAPPADGKPLQPERSGSSNQSV